jgi:hypothetical protein
LSNPVKPILVTAVYRRKLVIKRVASGNTTKATIMTKPGEDRITPYLLLVILILYPHTRYKPKKTRIMNEFRLLFLREGRLAVPDLGDEKVALQRDLLL